MALSDEVIHAAGALTKTGETIAAIRHTINNLERTLEEVAQVSSIQEQTGTVVGDIPRNYEHLKDALYQGLTMLESSHTALEVLIERLIG